MSRLFSMPLIVLVLVTASTALAERKPTPKAEILAPKAGAELQGRVRVRVKLPPGLDGPVYAGIGGPPWVRLERLADGGQWQGKLNSRLVPNGRHNLMVETANKRADTAIGVTVSNPLKVYFSDLHSHTGYSDGTLVPVAAHDYALKTAKLDVYALTDHLEQVTDTEWLDMRRTAWQACRDGRFVVLPGLEWTKKVGHINIYDPKTRHWPADIEGFYKAAAQAGVVCKFNHPGRGDKVFGGLAYSETGDKALQLMEVRRPEEEQAYIRALNHGWHIAPDGSDDTHNPNWGSSFAWSGILAPGLSARNILDALKNRRCYSTLDRNCVLSFTVNGAPMGEIIDTPAKDVSVRVAVSDPDDDDLIAKIELFEDGRIVRTDEPNSDSRRWRIRIAPAPGAHYYFVKVTQKDGNALWSAPVWVTIEGQ